MKYGYLLFILSLLLATCFLIDYTRYTRMSAFENQRPVITYSQRIKATNRPSPNPTFGPPRPDTKPSKSSIPTMINGIANNSGKIRPGSDHLRRVTSTATVKNMLSMSSMPASVPASVPSSQPIPPKGPKVRPGAGHPQHATHRPDIITHL
jgi:hypothetical protein